MNTDGSRGKLRVGERIKQLSFKKHWELVYCFHQQILDSTLGKTIYILVSLATHKYTHNIYIQYPFLY